MKQLSTLFLILAAAAMISCGKDGTPPPEQKVVVISVMLNKTALDLVIAATETLTATVAPADATDKTIIWESSDATVATVSEVGVVTAIKVGSATIWAISTDDKTKKGSCTVTVTEALVPLPPPSEYTSEVESGLGIAPTAGDGTAASPYLLASGVNLKWLKGQPADQTKDKHYKLTTDINITTPIWSVQNPFSGNFDGNNHTISGKLTADESREYNFGFFGELLGAATIKNLNVTAEIYAPNAKNIGAIAGFIRGYGAEIGAITNCTNSGKVTCKSTAGGIVGYINYNIPANVTNVTFTLISDCTNSGNIISEAEVTTYQVGGIVGEVYLSLAPKPATDPNNIYVIKNCTNTGNVTISFLMERAAVGGIIGNPALLYVTLHVKGCSNSGIVKCGTGADAIAATTERGSYPYYIALICCENFSYDTEEGDFTNLIVSAN